LRELNKGRAVRIAFLTPQQEVLATVEGRFNNDDILPATWPTGKVLVGTYWLPVPEPGPGWSQFRLNVALNGKPLFPLDHNGDPAEPVLPVPAP
jgi:hypothetical protein